MWVQGNLFLLIFTIVLYIYPSYTTAQNATIFFHVEEKGSGQPLRVVSTRTFDDGTVVARIVRNSATTPNCFEPTLSLRIINPNGVVDEKDITLDIQAFNYCETQILNYQYLDYQLIRKNNILVTYYNATDPNNISTSEQWGMIIDYDGNVLSRMSFGAINQIVPVGQIILNTNRESGFIILTSIKGPDGSNDTLWGQYKVELDGTFTTLTNGMIYADFFSSNTISATMSTASGDYVIAYASRINTFDATNPLLSQSVLYALTVGYNQTTVSPLILYQTPLDNVLFNALSCDISISSVGQVCTLTVSQNGTNGQPIFYYIEINFLSSGSVISSDVVTHNIPTTNGVNPATWKIKSLPFGGFLFTNSVPNFIYGYIFNDSNPNPISWNLPNPEPINSNGIFQLLPNNTLLVFQNETNNSWQVNVVNLPSFIVGKTDNGYSNINVNTTSPKIQDSIDKNVTSVSITYYDPVEKSSGNLSIYQVVNDLSYLPSKSIPGIYKVLGNQRYLLRQSIPGTECTIQNNSTVVAKLLYSTFSVPQGNYFITIDNDFVINKSFKEPLLGIGDDVWTFTTNGKKDPFTNTKSGLFRLTAEGTNAYDRLSQSERQDFFNNLKQELSIAVPVDPSRLTTVEKTQLDRSASGRQYLISISIKETNNNGESSVGSIIDYINAMVKNKGQTSISSGKITNYLDDSYGFNRLLSIWERHRTHLIILFFIILFFVGLFISAEIRSYREKKDTREIRNIAILQFGLIVFDLVMDVLFVSTSAKDFPSLYIASVVFVAVPIAFNTVLAFYIITWENSQSDKKFYEWFINNGKIASVFTVLAGADIDALNILRSNLLGIDLFKAPFKKSSTDKITWGGYLNIFIEDIPQVIIQIVYYRLAVDYDLIPLLAFVSSVLTLTLNLTEPIIDRIQHRGTWEKPQPQ